MKLIMENFRKFILSERKSDEVYIKTAQFIVNNMTLDNYRPYEMRAETVPFDEAKKPFDLQKFLKSMDAKYTPLQRKFLKVKATNEDNWNHDNYYFQLNTYKLKDLWKKYQQEVGSTLIFDSFETFKTYYSKLNIFATHSGEPGVNILGSMDGFGNMVFYLGDAVNDTTAKKILDLVKDRAYDIVIHEGTHFLNLARARGEATREAGGKKEQDALAGKLGRKEQDRAYLDSTEELQARIITAFELFKKENWRDKDKEEIYVKLYGNDTQGAIIDFLDIFYNKRHSGINFEKHSDSYKQKLYGRVYDFFKRVVKSQDYKEWIAHAESQGIVVPRQGGS